MTKLIEELRVAEERRTCRIEADDGVLGFAYLTAATRATTLQIDERKEGDGLHVPI
jgi:hypothetical protein